MPEIKLSKTWLARSLSTEHFHLSSGNPIMKKYTPEYDKQGNLQLVESGEHDLYSEIQSYAAGTDLALILNRYFNGDPAALSRVQGAYMDVSAMPTNIHEAMTLMQNARSDFETLPVDIKAKFANDPNQFLATLGTAEWFDKMQLPKKEEEVKENAE